MERDGKLAADREVDSKRTLHKMVNHRLKRQIRDGEQYSASSHSALSAVSLYDALK